MQIQILQNKAYFDSIETFKILFDNKIYCEGTTSNQQQNKYLGPPFLLDDWQIVICNLKNLIIFEDKEFIEQIKSTNKYKIAKDLYDQGFYVTSGKKYGADFLIYKDDPYGNHAEGMIFIDNVDLLQINRVSTIAKKKGFLTKIINNKIQYIQLSRIK